MATRRFRFKFAPILKQRKSREEEALRVLGVAQGLYQHELMAKARLKQTLEEALIRRENLGKQPTTILAFQLEQDHIVGTKQRIIQSDQAILRASRQVEKALRAYLHARRQTRMLETLYEKHFVEWKKERARKEQKELEDLTIMRARLNDESDDTIVRRLSEEGEVA